MTLRRLVLSFFAIGAAFALSSAGGAAARGHRDPAPTGLPGIALGALPPDVAFDTGDGTRPLHTRFGRPLVLNFWASWCAPCIEELDQFADAEARFGDRIRIVTISDEPRGVASGLLATRGLSLPVVVDDGKRLEKAFGVSQIPVTLVLRADGTLAHVSVGELDPGELDSALAPLASEPPGNLTPHAGSGTLRLMPGTPSL